MHIQVHSSFYSSEKLYEILEKEFSWSEDIKPEIVLRENNVGDRALDPFVLWILTTVGSAVITTLVEKAFERFNAKKINITQDGKTISISSADEIEKIELKNDNDVIIYMRK